MGGDHSQKLLPWRGISLLSGAQTSGSQLNQHQHCTEKPGRISVGAWLSYTRRRSLAQLHTALIILGKHIRTDSDKRRRRSGSMGGSDELQRQPGWFRGAFCDRLSGGTYGLLHGALPPEL